MYRARETDPDVGGSGGDRILIAETIGNQRHVPAPARRRGKRSARGSGYQNQTPIH
jgi:hypothetical protein